MELIKSWIGQTVLVHTPVSNVQGKLVSLDSTWLLVETSDYGIVGVHLYNVLTIRQAAP